MITQAATSAPTGPELLLFVPLAALIATVVGAYLRHRLFITSDGPGLGEPSGDSNAAAASAALDIAAQSRPGIDLTAMPLRVLPAASTGGASRRTWPPFTMSLMGSWRATRSTSS